MFTTGNVSLEAFKLLISLTTSKKKKDTLSHALISVKVCNYYNTVIVIIFISLVLLMMK